MMWFALKLLGIGKWLKEAVGSILGWARRNPSQAIIIALSLLLVGALWHYSARVSDLTRQRDKAKAETAQILAAGKQALELQKRVNAETKRRYDDLARRKDSDHAQELARANDAAELYIASHRLPKQSGSGSSPASPTSAGDNPSVLEGMSEDAVVVSADDLRICTANTAYAIDAYKWASELSAATAPVSTTER